MELSVSELWMSQPEPGKEPEAEIARFALLIERAISGDRLAFGEIVVRHERRVLTLALRFLGTMEDAQDAAQEVFLRTFKYLCRFDRTKPLEPWLVRMTVNVCRGLGRKRQRQQGVFLYGEVDRPDPGRSPHEDLSIGEQRQMLYRALDGLPEGERTAIVLRDIEGLTTAEVGAILGTSEATVRSQISVARLKVRKAVDRMKGGRR